MTYRTSRYWTLSADSQRPTASAAATASSTNSGNVRIASVGTIP